MNQGINFKRYRYKVGMPLSWGTKIRTIRAQYEGLKRKLTTTFEELNAKEKDDENVAELIDTKIHLNLEIDKDEMYWKKRPKINWLKIWDKSTAFFHNYASQRKHMNHINCL